MVKTVLGILVGLLPALLAAYTLLYYAYNDAGRSFQPITLFIIAGSSNLIVILISVFCLYKKFHFELFRGVLAAVMIIHLLVLLFLIIVFLR